MIVLFWGIVLFAAIAFVTQALGSFYFWVVLPLVLLTEITFFYLLYKLRVLQRPVFVKKFDWVGAVVIAAAFLALWQAHYNYTGEISSLGDSGREYHQVQNFRYPYPYYSDEWYSALLIKNSIESHSLPVKSFGGEYFPNLEMFFHSFLAQIFLITGFNPVTQYALVSLFFGVFAVFLIYSLLKYCGISKLNAAVASLFSLFITCGANLPGLWHLIPVNLGAMFCLMGFCFLAQKNLKMALLAGIPVILFYPPLFIIYGIGLLFYDFGRLWKYFIFLAGAGIAAGIVFFPSKLFFLSFTGFYMPKYSVYSIVPLPALILFFPGIIRVFKDAKWLFYSFLAGASFWLVYNFSPYRMILDYQRVVFFTSIIVVIVSGFGLQYFEKYKNFKFVQVTILVLIFATIPFYTARDNWKNLILFNEKDRLEAYPRAPVNNYLFQDDLDVFFGIKSKKFLSISWKGTVIGVATDNVPVLTKEGTISVGSADILNNFLQSDCEKKSDMAKNMDLDYVYLYKFDCPDFEKIRESKEGFILYAVKKD